MAMPVGRPATGSALDSTTGRATTWKLGGTWQVNDDLTLRLTRSRDIRAPTLYDLYAGTQRAPTFVLDPHTGVNAGFSGISASAD